MKEMCAQSTVVIMMNGAMACGAMLMQLFVQMQELIYQNPYQVMEPVEKLVGQV